MVHSPTLHLLIAVPVTALNTQPKQLQEGSIYSGSQIEGSVHRFRNAWHGELKVAVIRNQREKNTGAQLILPFPLSVHGMVLLTFQVGLSISIKLI